MKGFVFTLPRKKKNRREVLPKFAKIHSFMQRYGSVTLLTFSFSVGILLGAVVARNAQKTLLNALDFLFITNLDVRLNQAMYLTFASSFASNFIFILGSFLCGVSAFGMLALPLITTFKGYGIGLCAGYLFTNFGLRGVGFYLLVILGGTFLFSFALIMESVRSQALSVRIFQVLFLRSDDNLSVYVHGFLLHSLYMLLLSAAASLADTFLWGFFSGLFF